MECFNFPYCFNFLSVYISQYSSTIRVIVFMSRKISFMLYNDVFAATRNYKTSENLRVAKSELKAKCWSVDERSVPAHYGNKLISGRYHCAEVAFGRWRSTEPQSGRPFTCLSIMSRHDRRNRENPSILSGFRVRSFCRTEITAALVLRPC